MKKNKNLSKSSYQLLDAAKNGDLQRASQLVREGVDVNALDDRGVPWDVTPLMYAAKNGHKPIVQFLLEAKANIKLKDKSVAGEGGARSVLHYAVKGKNLSVVQLLLEAGAEINAISKESASTPIAEAAREGANEIALLLLKKGADAGLAGKNALNALMAAIDAKNTDLIEPMLSFSKGLDINQRGAVGQTALMLAAIQGDSAAVRLLLRAKPAIDEQDNDGFTALMLAVVAESLDCVKLLVQAGAKVDICDEKGRNALDIARRDELPEIEKYLISKGAKS